MHAAKIEIRECVKWSQSLKGGGSLLEVPTVRLWLGKFLCFGSAVAHERWSLTRGGRTWRFDCINNQTYISSDSSASYRYYVTFPLLKNLLSSQPQNTRPSLPDLQKCTSFLYAGFYLNAALSLLNRFDLWAHSTLDLLTLNEFKTSLTDVWHVSCLSNNLQPRKDVVYSSERDKTCLLIIIIIITLFL